MQNERFDVAIIGTGPAGISAAITLKIRNKNIILFGSKNLSAKLEKAHLINNYPGFFEISGVELQKKFTEHLNKMQISIEQEQIISCYAMGEYFSLLSKSNKIYEAKSIIVATGVNFEKNYEGEEKFLGRGVSYCATCDGPLFKDKTVIAIAQSKNDEEEAEFLSEIAQKVYFVPLYKEECGLNKSPKIEIVKDIPLKIEGNLKAEKVVFKNCELMADGIFILREAVLPNQLVPGIEIEANYIKVDKKMRTNLKGCFACGDITGTPYQYIKSAGEGNVAALSAVEFLKG